MGDKTAQPEVFERSKSKPRFSTAQDYQLVTVIATELVEPLNLLLLEPFRTLELVEGESWKTGEDKPLIIMLEEADNSNEGFLRRSLR